jgi:aspartyl/asparaginyl-tRNA synthetase
MRDSSDGETVDSFDLLVPGIGESMGIEFRLELGLVLCVMVVMER